MNARRHAGATQVSVTLAPVGDGDLSMTITDDGRGFDKDGMVDGMGTTGMRERAVLIGARLEIDSVPGGGTSVLVILPRPALARGRA